MTSSMQQISNLGNKKSLKDIEQNADKHVEEIMRKISSVEDMNN